MGFRDWWRNKSGKAKTITVLATLLILQIGLCFGTPSFVDFYQAIFHIKPSANEEFGPGVGYMIVEAGLAAVTGLALAVAVFSYVLSYLVERLSRPKE